MNVVFICVDCLREDFVSKNHAETPFLDSLIDSGLYFEEMFSTTTTTTPAVASYMTGLYSERNGVNSLQSVELDPDVTTLAERFSDAGYSTHAEVTGPITEETGLNRGFDEYNYREKDEGLLGNWATELYETIDSLADPFFLYLHLWEIHDPIDVPETFDSTEYGATPYARMLSAVDRELETLHGHLPDDTVFCLIGDHGESITHRHNPARIVLKLARDNIRYKFGIDTRPLEQQLNRWLNNDDIKDHFLEALHGENTFDFTSNIPFLIAGEGIEPETVSEQVREIDIYPTLLDLADIESEGVLDSKTLLQDGDVSPRPAYTRACGTSLHGEASWARSIRADGWRYVEYPNRDWEPELYNLQSDPHELSPVDDDHKKREMKDLLPSEKLRESEEIHIQDRLEDLGYL